MKKYSEMTEAQQQALLKSIGDAHRFVDKEAALRKGLGVKSAVEGMKLEHRYCVRTRGRRAVSFDFNRSTDRNDSKFYRIIQPKRIPTEQIVYIAPEKIGPRNYHSNGGDTFQHILVCKWEPDYDYIDGKYVKNPDRMVAQGLLNVFLKDSDHGIVGLEVSDLGLSDRPKRDRMPTPQFVAPNKNVEWQTERTDVPWYDLNGKFGHYRWYDYLQGHYGKVFSTVELIKDRLLLMEGNHRRQMKDRDESIRAHREYHEQHLDVLIIGNYEMQEKDIY